MLRVFFIQKIIIQSAPEYQEVEISLIWRHSLLSGVHEEET